MKKIFMLLGFIILSFMFVSCNEEYKTKSINNIEQYYEEIKAMEIEYSLDTIDKEVENAKHLIKEENNKKKIKSIEEDTIVKIEELLIEMHKTGSINKIEEYYQEIKAMGTEYRLFFIDDEVENAKEVILNTNDIEKIKIIEENALIKMQSLLLTEAEMKVIKESYYEYNLEKGIEKNNIQILYYLGQFENDYVVMIKLDTSREPGTVYAPESIRSYSIKTSNKIYFFDEFPALISVNHNNQYYTLKDAANEGLLSDEELQIILYKYNIINERHFN